MGKIKLNIIVIIITFFISTGILPINLSYYNNTIKAEQIDIINLPDSPDQYDYFFNTWSENYWHEFSIESDKNILNIIVNYTWITDQYSDEGSLLIMSPIKTIVEIGTGETNGSYKKTLSNFNGEPIEGVWRIWIEDNNCNGGHKATNISLKFISYGGKNQCPKVSIKYPTNEQTIKGIINVNGEAHDPNGDWTINWVMINIDNKGWLKTEGTIYWNYELDSTTMEDGEHTISVICYDGYLQSSCLNVFFKVGNNNDPPYSLSNVFPLDGAENISCEIDLEWNGGDPDINDIVVYNIYLGNSTNPPLFDNIYKPADQKIISYNPRKLDDDTKYYCKIFAKDKYGETNNSVSWNFTTKKAGEWGLVKEYYSADKGNNGEQIKNNNNYIEYENEYDLDTSSIFNMINAQSNTPYIAQEELIYGQVGHTYRVPNDTDSGKREVKFEMCINYNGILSSKFLGIAEEKIQYIIRDKYDNIITKDDIENFKHRSFLTNNKYQNGKKNISIIVDLQEDYVYTLYLKSIAKTTNWLFSFNRFEFPTLSKVDFGGNNHFVKYDHIKVYLK